MVAFQLQIKKSALKDLESLPEYVREKFKALADDPFPGAYRDKELIHRKGHKVIYR